MERVTSKSLFNFRLKGVVDEDILANEVRMFEQMGMGENALDMFANMTESELSTSMKAMTDMWMNNLAKHPIFVQGSLECDHSSIQVPTKHCGDYSVLSLVHTPKSMRDNTKRPALVYAHGGGVIGGTAESYKSFLSTRASNCGVVVFNVDYRLAPETRCPNNVLDFYHTLKYIVANAADLGVDHARIAIAGESGGGYIVAGTMVMLAKNEESSLVKLAIPDIPMLSDYSFTSASAMTNQEREGRSMMHGVWRAIAGPEQIDNMMEDPLLFPGKASDELLKRMPPTIVWEAEFDSLITEATRFAARLRAAGRLLELVVLPGAKHCSGLDPSLGAYRINSEAYRLAIQEYLIN